MNLPANAGDAGSIPGLGTSPGEGNGNSLQYSCLESSVDRGAWQATVRGVTKSQIQPNMHTCTVLVRRKTELLQQRDSNLQWLYIR